MNDVYDLLVQLKNLGARLYSVDDKIKLDIEPGVLNSELSDKIRYYRKDLLSLLQEASKKSDFVKIEKVAAQESYAPSDGQRRFWILSQFEGGSAAYRISGNLYLDAKINVESVKKSLWSVLERHESLRTVYKLDESGELRQWILSVEDCGFKIDYQDFRNEQNKTELVESYLAKISRQEFDLENGPLFKVSLIRLEDEDYITYYDVHHINADGWSMNVFFSDLNKFYDAYQAGQTPEVAPLKFQYKDYAAWQLNILGDESSNSHRTYWLETLKGELPRLDLPGHKPRPKLLTYRGEAYKGSFIGARAITKLKKYSEEKGGSLFIGLFAAWNVLMYRYTSQEDIIIGTPLNGREHADTLDQIGLYVNTLAIRNKLSAEESFDSTFEKVKQNMLDAYSHQVYPFNRLVEELNVPKDVSRNAVFDIMLVYNSSGKKSDSASGSDQSSQMVQVANTTSRFDLEVGFREMDNYIQVWGVYNPDVYEEEVIENLITHYKRLLDGLVDNPEEKISQIDYLSEAEKHQLLVTFNDTAVAYPKDKTIVDLFEEQAAKTPDHVAVVFEDTELTYQALDERSNQLAHYLRENYQIRPDDLVAIQLERSEWMLVSILGVLKAGGAYVPIDPHYPQERISYLQADTRCKVCLDETALTHFKASRQRYPTQTLPLTATADNLIYVLYTSGSTGKPKGVLLEHRGLVNRLLWMKRQLQVEASDVFLQKTPVTFDVSVWELLLPLVSGSKLVVARPEGHKDPLYLHQVLAGHKVSIVHFVPSMLSAALPAIGWERLAGLRHVVCSGEALGKPLEEAFRARAPFVSLHNYYGPTEASIDVTAINLSRHATLGKEVPIGRPVDNTRIYIVNEKHALQPAGVLGEILIGGDQVARGYLNQEGLTQEKFIASPFKPAERLYKTGDLGRWLPDGTIAFIGRKDDQVKIRGQRIELAEIEQAFSRIAGIKQSCVVVKEREGETGSAKYLVGYYLPEESAAIAPEDIFTQLSKVLPDYMLPSSVMAMESFPLSVNGKVNKRALPDPDFSSSDAYVAPVTEIEIALCKIWQEVLGLERVGISDNFFRIGGNSISAIRISHLISKKLGVEFPIKDIFICPTITLIIDRLEVKSYTGGILTNNSLNTHSSTSTSDIEENLYYTLPLPSSRYWAYKSGYLNSLSATILKEFNHVDEKVLSRTLDTMVSRHESLRTVFLSRGGMVLQKVCNEETFVPALLIDDIRAHENKDEEIERIINDLSTYSFDFEKEPSFKCKLIKYREDKYVFVFVIDHIIYDAHSLKTIERELFTIYDAYLKGLPNPLEPLNEQLKDFSMFCQKHYEGDKLAYHKAYFRNIIEDAPPRLKIKPNDGVTENSFKAEGISETHTPVSSEYPEEGGYKFVVPEDVLRKIHIASSEMEITFLNFMLASYCLFLSRVTFQKDFVIDSPMSTRSKEDHSRIVGWLTGTLVTRIKVDENDTFKGLIKRCSNAFIDAVDHIYYQSSEDVLHPDWNQVATQFNILNDMHTAEGSLENFIPFHFDKASIYFDIAFQMEAFKNGMLITCSYKRSFISKHQISDVCGRFLEVLNTAINAPDVKIKDLE